MNILVHLVSLFCFLLGVSYFFTPTAALDGYLGYCFVSSRVRLSTRYYYGRRTTHK